MNNETVSSDGFEYTLISHVPEFSVDELRAAPNVVPDEIAARNVALPSDVEAELVDLAVELTAGQPPATT